MKTKRRLVIINFLVITVFLAGTYIYAAASQSDMPQGLWQAFSKAVHQVEPARGENAKGYFAQNPKNHLVFNFSENGFTVKSGMAGDDWSLTMELGAYGQEGRLSPVPAPKLVTEGKRIEYQRGRVKEWYVNNPSGLEQGFTLEKPEGYNPDKPIILSMNLEGGLIPVVTNGRDATFSTPDKSHAFDYKGLKAFDKNNKPLESRLALVDERLVIQVNAGHAPWPITVDPIISTQTKLLPQLNSVITVNTSFGTSVALDGDYALVGAPLDDTTAPDSGAAYVFVRTGSTWKVQALLLDATGATNDHFGVSVAISGDTALVGADLNDDNAPDSGAAFVFIRFGNTWSEQAELLDMIPCNNCYLGTSVAISGDTALVGAKGEGGDKGAAYLFERSGTIWSAPIKLTASDREFSDEFGTSVALSGDTAVIGAPLDDNPTYDNIGSAYLFEKPVTGWTSMTETAKLTASEGYLDDKFGYSVSISGDTAVVGAVNWTRVYVFEKPVSGWANNTETAILEISGSNYTFGTSVSISGDRVVVGDFLGEGNVPFSGAAYVFERSGSIWLPPVKLSDLDGAANDNFGTSVAISGDTILIGADGDDDNGDHTGSAHAFYFNGATWEEQDKVYGYQSTEYYNFGTSVAISGDSALIGAPDEAITGPESGSVYVFERSGSMWDLQSKLYAYEGRPYAQFGISISLDNDTALIGASKDDGYDVSSGSAYVFIRSGSTWNEQAKITASDGAENDSFGYSVSLSGDTALIGAFANDGNVADSGAAYVFVRSGSTWSQQAKLTAVDGATGDDFGESVSLFDDTALIGASRSTGNVAYSGAAYVFVRPGAGWADTSTFDAKLTASDGAEDDYFGESVSLSGDTALIGARFDEDNGYRSGSAYMFTRSGTSWSEQTKLSASDGNPYDTFGGSLSISGDTALIGANGDDMDNGSAYIFVRAGNGWIEQDKLTASDQSSHINFGVSVSLYGDTTLVGSNWDDANGHSSGSAYIDRFECGFGGGVVAGRWTMVGMPCDVGTSNTVEDVFGDNFDPSQYLSDWVLYKRDEISDLYVRLNLTSQLEQGRGYWLYSKNWGVWDAQGELTSYVQSGLCDSSEGCFEITLTSPDSADTFKWNQVGNPVNKTVNWSGFGILVDGTLHTPSEAELFGYVSKTFYKYNGNAYEAYDDGTPGMEGTLESHEGFWVKVLGGSNGHTIKLLIPNGETIGGPPDPPTAMNYVPEPQEEQTSWWEKIIDFIIPSAHAAQPQRLDEWYLRLIVETPGGDLRDKNNVLGQLMDSVDGYDSHDLPELPPFAAPYLTIVFPHNDWGDKADDYSSDYHAAGSRDADQWVFQVKSDDPYRSITLLWENIKMLQSQISHTNNKREWTTHREKSGESLMSKMWLEDLDTGVMLKAVEDGIPQSYSFNMDGKTVRTFRWIKKDPRGKLPKEPKNISNRFKHDFDPKKLLPPQAQGEPPRPGHEK